MKATRQIADLTPNVTGGMITGRVVSKTSPKSYNGGHVFNFVLHDESGEINVVAPGTANTTALLHETIEIDKCYALTVFGIRAANNYNPTDHPNEIFLRKVQPFSTFIVNLYSHT